MNEWINERMNKWMNDYIYYTEMCTCKTIHLWT